MAQDRNVSLGGGHPLSAGGQDSRALSVPIREDSPAARITPAKLGARTIRFLFAHFTPKTALQFLIINRLTMGVKRRVNCASLQSRRRVAHESSSPSPIRRSGSLDLR